MVQKRSGELQPYDPNKIYQVILWAADGSETFATQLLSAIDIKIHNQIKIDKLYDELIATASNLISDMYPKWETIARNLYLLKLHKDIGVKRAQYPSYLSVIDANVQAGLYSKELLDTYFTEDTIQQLADTIDKSYDSIFTFGGLNLFVQKYCNNHKGQLLELPQHVYMRVAIQLMHTEGVQAVINKYHQLATHSVTEATPKMVNSLRPNAQSFSCCLARPEDSQESINATADMLSGESKFGGGLSSDVSAIRAKGSPVKGNKGTSGGVVPFIQEFQWTTGAFNQGNTRSSAMAMYYNWFHYESPEITMLKDESGKDEDRARKLKYSVKWTKQLSDAIRSDDSIYLFDPHKTQDMTFAYGDELIKLYNQYSKNTSIRKRKYSARELALTLAKVKLETGNNYTFFTDNANLQNIGSGTITQSNLCCEYMPSFDTIKHVGDDLITSHHYGTYVSRSYTGDIALCNLSSVNLMSWVSLDAAGKASYMDLLVRSMDNAIDNSFYANQLGRKHSFDHRNLGIGVSNYANLLASNQLLWDSPEARKLTHEVFEELQFYAIKASVNLAAERGRYPLYSKSKWATGVFPHELSMLPESLSYPLLCDWESLRHDLIRFGIRNEYLMAIAPTATSGQCINATPGVDLPRKLRTIQEGTYSLPFVVPNLLQNREYYQTTFEVVNKHTIELAAIRQKFVCMGQSVSLAYPNPDSAFDVINDIMYAEQLGLKSLYYTFTPNADDLSESSCENCSS